MLKLWMLVWTLVWSFIKSGLLKQNVTFKVIKTFKVYKQNLYNIMLENDIKQTNSF